VHEVPVVGKTIMARILAHRGNAYAIGQCDSANGKWVKYMGHILLGNSSMAYD
jgi:hypothetical protein